jgi:hypothetical protein
MNSLYYLAMLIGVGWLMVWSVLPPDLRGKGWWPFDMRDGAEEPGKAGNQAADAVGRRRRGEPDPAAKSPSPSPRQPLSWRTRRETAPPSRRDT